MPAHAPRRSAGLAVALLLAALLPACSSTDLKFQPQGQQPFHVAGTDLQVRIQVTHIDESVDPPELHARFLIAGDDADVLVLDPAGTTLTTGDLHDLGTARLITGGEPGKTPGRRAYEVGFALPQTEVDLTALYLDWTVKDDAGVRIAGPPARFKGVVTKSPGWFKPKAGVGIGPNGPVWNGGIGL